MTEFFILGAASSLTLLILVGLYLLWLQGGIKKIFHGIFVYGGWVIVCILLIRQLIQV